MKARFTHIYKLSLSAFLCGETPFRLLNRLGRAYVRAHDTPEGWARMLPLDRLLGIQSVFHSCEYFDSPAGLAYYSTASRYGYWNFDAPDCLPGTIGRLYIW